MKKGQHTPKIDEFAFVLLAGVVFILILSIFWSTPLEAAPLVEPTSIVRSFRKGSDARIPIKISGAITNVTLTGTGEIAGWFAFPENGFDVKDSKDVMIEVYVPTSATMRTYNGGITVTSPGGSKDVKISIKIANETGNVTKREMMLGDFSVSLLEDVLDSKENVEIFTGYLAEEAVNLVCILSKENLSIVTEGEIQIVVEDTNSLGKLTVLFNDVKIFDMKVGPGEVLIPIEKSLIKKSNTVTIRAGDPGMAFWMNTVYRLRTANFKVKYEETHDLTFVLDSKEVFDFAYGRLDFKIKERQREGDMIIKINNQKFYDGRPGLYAFGMDFGPETLLNIGTNTISFSVEAGGFYRVSDVILTIARWT